MLMFFFLVKYKNIKNWVWKYRFNLKQEVETSVKISSDKDKKWECCVNLSPSAHTVLRAVGVEVVWLGARWVDESERACWPLTSLTELSTEFMMNPDFLFIFIFLHNTAPLYMKFNDEYDDFIHVFL